MSWLLTPQRVYQTESLSIHSLALVEPVSFSISPVNSLGEFHFGSVAVAIVAVPPVAGSGFGAPPVPPGCVVEVLAPAVASA